VNWEEAPDTISPVRGHTRHRFRIPACSESYIGATGAIGG
jgi:hypothetical protein